MKQQNDRIAKWWNDKMTKFWNAKMMEQKTDDRTMEILHMEQTFVGAIVHSSVSVHCQISPCPSDSKEKNINS